MNGRDLQKLVILKARSRGCIRGTGISNGQEYPRQMRNGVRKGQHVWAWEDAHGAVPEGIVHHVCESTLSRRIQIGFVKRKGYGNRRDKRSLEAVGPETVQAFFGSLGFHQRFAGFAISRSRG